MSSVAKKAKSSESDTKAKQVPLGGAASTPHKGKQTVVTTDEGDDHLEELLVGELELEEVIGDIQKLGDTASVVSTPSAGVVLSQLAHTVIPSFGASESINKAKDPVFSYAAPSVEADVILKTKEGLSFKLPILKSLHSRHAAEFVQELIRIAAQIGAHSEGITVSTPSEKDVSLDAEQVLRIKGNPLEALDSILKQNLRMLLSGEALSSVRTICFKASVLQVTNADILNVVSNKAKHHMSKDTNPAKYIQDMKQATADMPVLQRPSMGNDAPAEEYALMFMNKVEELHSMHATLLNGSDVNRAQHAKGVLGMLKPASFMYYVLHKIINEPGYTESLWKDVREVLNRIHEYSVQLDGMRILNKDYLNQFTVNSHLPLWDIGVNSRLSHFKTFWPAAAAENSGNTDQRKSGSGWSGTDQRKSGSGWGGKEQPRGKSPQPPKHSDKHLPKGDAEGKRDAALRDKDSKREVSRPAPEVPVVGKISGPKKDKGCIICGELGHKGDHCAFPCACGIIPATSIEVTGKRHNPWDCPTMKGKRGVNKRKRDDGENA